MPLDTLYNGAAYASARPLPPPLLHQWIKRIAPSRSPRDRRLWDSGAGTGQVTNALKSGFSHVVGTDINASQIAQAKKAAGTTATGRRVKFHVAPSEKPKIRGTRNFDVVTGGTWYHWAHTPGRTIPAPAKKFLQHAKRLLKPDGIVAVWAYPTDPTTSYSAINAVIKKYGDVLRQPEYAYAEHKHVDNGYKDIFFPASKEIAAPPGLRMNANMNLSDLVAYYSTQSAFINMEKNDFRTAEKFIAGFQRDLEKVWDEPTRKLPFQWPVHVRAARARDLKLRAA